jgi:hypothetical protein
MTSTTSALSVPGGQACTENVELIARKLLQKCLSHLY